MRKGYIKLGAIVGQDFSFFKWNKPEQIFDMHSLGAGTRKYRCVANGYGVLGSHDGRAYGNGAIYTLKENIVFLDSDDQVRENDRAY